MRKLLTLSLAFVSLMAFGQDEKAKGILDKVSAKTKAYKTIKVEFKITITPAGEGEPITNSGKASMMGEKYFVQLDEQDIYCDGKTITTHLKEEDECYTSDVEESSEDGIVSPNEMLTIWEDGYKYKYVKETTVGDVPAHQIHLYPKDAAKSKFHTIILKINKEKNEVMTVLIKAKDGSKMQYTLISLEADTDIPSSTFVFDRSKHPEVECFEE
jgi:outer membrane lipoprotein-sorting protein